MSNFELHELILPCDSLFFVFYFPLVQFLFPEWIQTVGNKELRGHAVLFLIPGLGGFLQVVLLAVRCCSLTERAFKDGQHKWYV